MYKIGIVGCGSRMHNVLKELSKQEDIKVAVIVDPRASELHREFGDSVQYFDNIDEYLDSGIEVDGYMVGTRCDTHTDIAIKLAKTNKPLFLEKPVSINLQQLKELETLLDIDGYNDKVVVSFPLRGTDVVKKAKDIIDSGALGRIEQVQSWNNCFYGRGFYHKWFRDESITGGLFIQKATHDVDYIHYLVGGTPSYVCGVKSKEIFKGDMPAGLKCKDCHLRKTCPESDVNVASYESEFFNGGKITLGEYCCFAEDTGNEDCSSMLIMYEDGTQIAYTQNFVIRRNAGGRGARLIGYLGTLILSFEDNTVDVIYHNEQKSEHYEFAKKGGHHGGDYYLTKNFADIIRGNDVSHYPLSEGIRSAKICLSANMSSENKKFYNIDTMEALV